MSNGLVSLYQNDIYNDKVTVGTLEALLATVRNHPTSMEMHCKLFELLAVIVARHSKYQKSTLLNEGLQEVMENILAEFINFRRAHPMKELDQVFLPKQVPYFITVLQYLLAYSKKPAQVVSQTVALARQDAFFGKEMLNNPLFLKELVGKLAARHYEVLEVFQAAAAHPSGCEQLRRLRLIENLQEHALT